MNPARISLASFQPDFAVQHRDREAKVLRVIPLPCIVDTPRGPRVLYRRIDGWYSRVPWDVPDVPADDEEE